jgi:hypothetical protein
MSVEGRQGRIVVWQGSLLRRDGGFKFFSTDARHDAMQFRLWCPPIVPIRTAPGLPLLHEKPCHGQWLSRALWIKGSQEQSDFPHDVAHRERKKLNLRKKLKGKFSRGMDVTRSILLAAWPLPAGPCKISDGGGYQFNPIIIIS